MLPTVMRACATNKPPKVPHAWVPTRQGAVVGAAGAARSAHLVEFGVGRPWMDNERNRRTVAF